MIPRYSRPEMSALWSDEARFQLWLEVETVALEGLVDAGYAPREALDAVKNRGNFSVERVLEIEGEVKHDVIAFLTNVAEYVGEEARFLHLGMTSSDLLDTTFSIQLARATDILLRGLDTLLESVKRRAFEHKMTVCVGRSHGIHAEPTTFGLKLAVWYAELERQRERLSQARNGIAVGAISGPVGTFAHIGPEVEAHVCKSFNLAVEPVSTQVIQRDRHAAYFSTLAVVATTLEKIAIEVRHLQRTEVHEAEEFFSKGQKGSSAMPHKRNPVLSENVTGLARLMRSWAQSSLENVALWHERDISHSSVERVIGPDMTVTLDFMLARTNSIVANLVVYPDIMRKNMESTAGLVYSGTVLVALAKKGLSREAAYKMVQDHAMKTWEALTSGSALAQGASFPDRIRGDKKIAEILTQREIEESLSLEHHLAHIDTIFQRVFRNA